MNYELFIIINYIKHYVLHLWLTIIQCMHIAMTCGRCDLYKRDVGFGLLSGFTGHTAYNY
jgi:hypothetical protein